MQTSMNMHDEKGWVWVSGLGLGVGFGLGVIGFWDWVD